MWGHAPLPAYVRMVRALLIIESLALLALLLA